ncbi:heterokaryon incompatibility protein-domain-containing protein, partial [Pisolithus orientalis]|uniref:heterokaryon incompatibility protein-domain-containing protein n=1 Tax=Pisolithus orientalis TaxID=936130 RepID=UPI00222416DF
MELVHTAILEYFQYIMLSHRWGEDEPSLRDIEGHLIYDMSEKEGFEKLQTFCVVACERGFLWAWSDTCCIDKDSSAELQEAIGSMFAWYRRSSLTIVYLSDVPDTGSFESSEWFRRGWTLQELLASGNILFYTQSWSLYKNLTSSNHKTDIAVLEELERATGIESRFLTHFSPGTDDARSRLQWASLRRTTRPEDIAYSLFGIFNLHLPVLYGESAENALGRLLAEIISQSGDISVLDWVGDAS